MEVIKISNLSIAFNQSNLKIDNLKDLFIKSVKKEIVSEKFWAVKDVSFTVNSGDAVGIIGLNGSGKSTLLKTIAGIYEVTHGSIEKTGKIAPLIELGAGFDPELNAIENIYLNGALLGYSREVLSKEVDSIIEFAELENFKNIPLKNFSSGMTARLGFSIATFTQPDILILDEVLAVGDYKFQEKSLARTRKIIDNGATVLFVSHSSSQLKEVCNRIVWMEKGVMKRIGGLEVIDEYENQ